MSFPKKKPLLSPSKDMFQTPSPTRKSKSKVLDWKFNSSIPPLPSLPMGSSHGIQEEESIEEEDESSSGSSSASSSSSSSSSTLSSIYHQPSSIPLNKSSTRKLFTTTEAQTSGGSSSNSGNPVSTIMTNIMNSVSRLGEVEMQLKHLKKRRRSLQNELQILRQTWTLTTRPSITFTHPIPSSHHNHSLPRPGSSFMNHSTDLEKETSQTSKRPKQKHLISED